ncbi:MAG: molecular chaperone [Firmicutes bacterium HGW-Firmicutes-13]|nr:MAG: molecular chaperone [Firmicutes bacterium HGW-Firmicutes-13]
MTKLIRWNPFTELTRMRDELDKIFDETFSRFPGEKFLSEKVSWQPSVDIYESEDEIVAKAELPGFKRDDINITVTEDSLNISGETKEEKEVEEGNYICKERRWGKFSRYFSLPAPIDTNRVKASYENGVIEIKMSKTEEAKRKSVNIEIE